MHMNRFRLTITEWLLALSPWAWGLMRERDNLKRERDSLEREKDDLAATLSYYRRYTDELAPVLQYRQAYFEVTGRIAPDHGLPVAKAWPNDGAGLSYDAKLLGMLDLTGGRG